MNYKHLLIAILAGAALVGCNKEAGKDVTGTEQEGERYMGFTISMPSAVTKAEGTGATGSYEVGKDYENAIKSIHFFFYKDGAYVSMGYGDMKDDFTAVGSTGNTEEILHDGTAAKEGVVVLESTMTEPNQVLCVINSRNYNWYKNKSLKTVVEALHTTSAGVTGNDTDTFKDFYFEDSGAKFVMFTSPMYGKNKAGTTEIKYADDIIVEKDSQGNYSATSNIQKTRAAAKANPVNIYVERMAARVEIGNLADIVDGSGYIKATNLGTNMLDNGTPVWDIKPLAWGVTAVNKNSYSIKNVSLDWLTQTGANEPFNGGWLQSGSTISNPVYPSETINTRINWAIDPDYGRDQSDRNNYPHSARELLPTSFLHYYSATQIDTHDDGTDAGSSNDILQRYCYENTIPATGQNNPRVSGTMVLLYAQARKHGAAAPVNLYAYMGQVYTSQEYAEHLLASVQVDGGLYVKDGGTFRAINPDPLKEELKSVKAAKIEDVYSNNPASLAKDWDKESTANPGKMIKEVYSGYIIDLSKTVTIQDATLTTLPSFTSNDPKGHSDGYITLVPNFAKIPGGKLYVIDTNTTTNPTYDAGTPGSEYREATAKELAEKFLHDAVEPANCYTEGKMYYAIPIEHFGKAKSTATPPALLEGNYGVVRNNLYRISIGKVNSLGHGIYDVDEPIVPGDRKQPFYLAAKINILSWQLATQTANLEE